MILLGERVDGAGGRSRVDDGGGGRDGGGVRGRVLGLLEVEGHWEVGGGGGVGVGELGGGGGRSCRGRWSRHG